MESTSRPRKSMMSKVVSLKQEIAQHRGRRSSLFVLLKNRAPLFLYLFWIASGTAFYTFYEEYPFHVALYQSTSVGWAIGWSLPNHTHTDSKVGTLYFSCFHNLVGVLFVGVIVTYIEIMVSRTTDHWMVEMTNRHGVEYTMPTNPYGKMVRWLKLHKDRVKINLICFGCCFLCILFGYYCTDSLTFAESCDMTLSTLSCGGYQGMPLEAGKGAYIFLALFTNVAVPLFLVAAGTLASIMMTKQDEKSFYNKIASPLTDIELKYMQFFGIENGDGVLDKKEFLILIIIRIGNIKPGNVIHIHRHYQELTADTGGTMSYASILDGGGGRGGRSASVSVLPGPDSKSSNVYPSNRKTRRLVPLPHRQLQRGMRDLSSRSWAEADGVDREAEEEEERLERARQIMEKAKKGGKEAEGRPQERAVGVMSVASRRGKIPIMKKKKTCLPKLSIFNRFTRTKMSLSKIQPVTIRTADEEDSGRRYPSFSREEDAQTPSADLQQNTMQNTKLTRTVPAIDSIETSGEGKQDRGMERTLPVVREADSAPLHHTSCPYSSHCTPPSATEASVASSASCTSSATLTSKDTTFVQNDAKPTSSHNSHSTLWNPSNISSGPGKANPFVLVRQFSRQESVKNKDLSAAGDNMPSTRPVLDIQRTDSTDLCPPFMDSVSPSLSISRTNLSKSGRKKFSSRKDRQSSYDRTVEMLGKGKEIVLAFVARNRQKRHKKNLRRSSITGLRKINEAQNALEKKLTINKKLEDENIKLGSALWLLAMDWLRDWSSYLQAFFLWLIWLVAGGVFYCYNMNISFYRGFYMSVNVGYAIYWTEEEDSASTKAFSVLNVLLGQLITTVAMAFFAGKLKQHWYAEAEEQMKLDDVNTNSNIFYFHCMKLLFFVKRNHVHCMSLMWLLFGVIWSFFAVKWSFIDALYFSITSLSTAGIWSIPDDSSDMCYFMVALFTCTGAPLLCLSAGKFAYHLCRLSHENDFVSALHTPITAEELEMMQALEIEEDDGNVDMTEYVLLILIRIKAVQPELIAAVLAHFNSIDSNKEGSGCSYDALLAPTAKKQSSLKRVLKDRIKRLSRDFSLSQDSIDKN